MSTNEKVGMSDEGRMTNTKLILFTVMPAQVKFGGCERKAIQK